MSNESQDLKEIFQLSTASARLASILHLLEVGLYQGAMSQTVNESIEFISVQKRGFDERIKKLREAQDITTKA